MSKKAEQQQMIFNREMMENALLSRSSLLGRMLDPRRDINTECGYPDDITPDQYRLLYDREGIGHRIVTVFPEESWTQDPNVFETEDPSETEFEKAWDELQTKLNIYHFMERIDIISGIGRFGVLLLGINDSQDLHQPVSGVDDRGEATESTPGERELLFIRAFDESVATVKKLEADIQNPRFGQPTLYDLQFVDINGDVTMSSTRSVHWTRIIHIADNRDTSEVYGVPRIQVSYNRVYDIRKVLSGSGEMFWKGAFPGYSFEVNPDITNPSLDNDALKEQLENYYNGLQRYIALVGISAKSLAPQVADPTAHIDAQLKVIAIALGVPQRVFFGSEQAKLASTQDSRIWNRRIARRQNKYLTPLVIRPFINRMIAIGILPEAEYTVEWDDLNTATAKEIAEVAALITKALATYVAGNVEMLIPPEEYLSMILGMDHEEIEQVMKSLDKFLNDKEREEEELAAAVEAARALEAANAPNSAPSAPGNAPGASEGP